MRIFISLLLVLLINSTAGFYQSECGELVTQGLLMCKQENLSGKFLTDLLSGRIQETCCAHLKYTSCMKSFNRLAAKCPNPISLKVDVWSNNPISNLVTMMCTQTSLEKCFISDNKESATKSIDSTDFDESQLKIIREVRQRTFNDRPVIDNINHQPNSNKSSGESEYLSHFNSNRQQQEQYHKQFQWPLTWTRNMIKGKQLFGMPNTQSTNKPTSTLSNAEAPNNIKWNDCGDSNSTVKFLDYKQSPFRLDAETSIGGRLILTKPVTHGWTIKMSVVRFISSGNIEIPLPCIKYGRESWRKAGSCEFDLCQEALVPGSYLCDFLVMADFSGTNPTDLCRCPVVPGDYQMYGYRLKAKTNDALKLLLPLFPNGIYKTKYTLHDPDGQQAGCFFNEASLR